MTTPPIHGGQLRAIAERFNIPASGLLDFSANINPEGPPAGVVSILRTALEDLSNLLDYPDLENTALRQSIARSTGLQANNIVVANGFVPLLEATLRTLTIDRCHLPVPAFNEYRRALARAKIEAVPHTLSQDEDFRYHPAQLFGASPGKAILLANPQNPTGILHARAEMEAIVTEAAARNTFVLLDEAFIDYAPEHTLTSHVDAHRNLIVFRSVTKFHGIPGLRVAYLATNESMARSIAQNLSPWPITTLASLAVGAALEDEPYAHRTRALNIQRRTALQARLAALGIATYPAAANYLLLRFPDDIDTTTVWQRLILEHGVVLRDCANYEALAIGHLRTAIRTDSENDRLIAALKQTLTPYISYRG